MNMVGEIVKLTEVKLKDISKNNRGYYGIGASAVDYDENKYTYLRITDINDDGTLNTTALMSVDDENACEFLLKENDIVFARTGASTGRNYFYDGEINNMVFAGFLIKFSLDKEKVNPRFIKYYCLSQNYKNWIASSLTGSTRPNINEKQLSEMPIILPDREYQDRAVKVLDVITKKIKLNNQVNDNLLELGTSLISNSKYNDFILLKDLSNVISKGTTPTGKDMDEYFNRDIKFIKVRDFNEYGVNENDIEYVPLEVHIGKLKRSILKKDDLLVSIAGTLGKIAIVNESLDNANTNQAVAFVRLKNNCNKGYLYFFMKTNEFQDEIIKRQVHAVQPNLSLTELGNIKVPKLNINETTLYNDLLNKILANNEMNKILEQLRDTLLPKLMNGEIDLDKIEI